MALHDYKRVRLPDLYAESVTVDGVLYGLCVKRSMFEVWCDHRMVAKAETTVGHNKTIRMGCGALRELIYIRGKKRRETAKRRSRS